MSDDEKGSKDGAKDDSSIPVQCASVAVKVPPFMENSVSNWFLVVEAQFKIARITSPDTRYYHVIGNLPTSVLDRLDQEALTTPDYTKLKNALINKYEKSKPELFRKMLENKKMTGKPSALMSELQAIGAKVGVGEEFIKHQFLEASPPSISSVLVSHNDLSLSQMAKLADSMLPYVQQPANDVFHVKPSATTAKNEPFVPISVRPYSHDQRPKICRAHIYFADRARTCKPWCKYPNKSSSLKMNPSSRASSPSSRRSSVSSGN